MCGKTNPSDRETCQFCNARIKPLYPDMGDDELGKLLGLNDSSIINHQSAELGVDEIPDWLSSLEEKSPDYPFQETNPNDYFSELASQDQEFKDENLISWGDDQEAADVNPQGEVQDDLQVANLPSWLEALRPVESILPADHAGEGSPISVEGAGPLAGLKGVIPAEPEISYPRKPFRYSVKLSISENQQAQATLLEQIIRSEGNASVLPRKESFVSPNRLRALLALLLAVSILIVLLAPDWVPVRFPDLMQYPSVWAAYQHIDQAELDKPVLVAVDYQPGLLGEMEAITGAVLKHLLSKNARLVFVTTQPLGTILAERVLDQVIQEVGIQYLPGQHYTNLGYLPGGNSGLLSFISDPRRTIPFSVDGAEVWQLPDFQIITNINSFSLVVVATEDTDTARFWIEQLTSSAIHPSIIMAVSAQAEPVVAPYYLASPAQVQGIIPGLAGATAYESVSYFPGGAIRAYAPFSLAGLLAVLFILLGSTFYALSNFISARRQEDKKRGDGK